MEEKVIVTEEKLKEMAVLALHVNSKTGIFKKIYEDIAKLVARKNVDYGDAWQRYGIFTPLIRINDKILRVKTLAGGQQALVADESVKDTLRDIVGYALLGLLWFEWQEKLQCSDAKQPKLFNEDLSGIDFTKAEAALQALLNDNRPTA